MGIKNVSIVLHPIFKNKMEPDTRERILKGAEELFFKYGIKSITMDDIAKHLAMSKKTIYLFFADKNEVVDCLLKESLQKDKSELDDITKKSANVIEEVYNLMKHMGAMFGKVNPNIFYDLQKYHPTAWKQFMHFKEDCMEGMVEGAIKRGIKEGLVREDVNSKVLSIMRIEQIVMGMNPDIFPPDKFKLVDVQVCMLDHFLHGICTLKGHKMINKYKQVIEEE